MKLNNLFYEIEITEDPTYRLFSVDNKPYTLTTQMKDYTRNDFYRTLSINVLDLSNNNLKSIAIVGGIYSFTTKDCAVLDGNHLVVLMQDTVAIFNLENFELLYKNKIVNMGTALHIYQFTEKYIIYGEIEIVLINKKAEIIWSFSGTDIFVLPDDIDGVEAFSIEGNNIIINSWNGHKYIIDENGKDISYLL